MVVGIDIDDTITRCPEFFAFLTRALVGAGHEVVIITFREDRAEAEAVLKGWGIVYDKLVMSSLDACFEYGVYEWKGAMCREYGVDVLFEDDPEVLKHVGDETVCMMPVDAKTWAAGGWMGGSGLER